MIRNAGDDIIPVVKALKQRHLLPGWDFKVIERMSETELTEMMAQSTIFLTFGHHEAIGLSSLEAMSSG